MKRLFGLVSLLALFSVANASVPKHLHWDYHGKSSSKNWAQLSSDFEKCGSGTEQSPLNLTPAKAQAANHQLEVFYHPSEVKVVNNGHTVEFDLTESNHIILENEKYELVQFHFHAKSEHTVNKKHTEAELHLVHKNKQGKLAVLGLMVDASESSKFDHLFDHIPVEGKSVAELVHLEQLLPKDRAHYYYAGSLTTPPCTEGVKWVVFEKHIKLPLKQLQKFEQHYDHNFREVRPAKGRVIYYSKS